MNKKRHSLILASAVTALTVTAHAYGPSWWSDRTVVTNCPSTNDYAAANQGQLKHVATQAYLEMNDKFVGGSGPAVSNLVSSFTTNCNYCFVNLGMLKYVAQPYYDRLRDMGDTNDYPWANAASADNYALANVGQVKYLFSFGVDTDDDGLPDVWETRYFGDATSGSPTVDSDSDGAMNDQEFASSTDPNSQDTDGDGLTDGVEINTPQAHTYRWISTNLTWSAAKTAAEAMGGHLATILSESEFLYISNRLGAILAATNTWIGATDETTEDTWVWVTGETMDYDRWATNQPNNYNGNQDYAHFWGWGYGNQLLWNDEGSATELSYLLEYDHYTSPTNNDTDYDGMPDGWEADSGINPVVDDANEDFDGDELINILEYIFFTEPFMYDTDGDGISDRYEIFYYSSNPNSGDSDNDGLTDGFECTNTLTNPLEIDTDSDGLVDGHDGVVLTSVYPDGVDADEDGYVDGELDLGTSPIHADTDNDGLPDGWEHQYGLAVNSLLTNDLAAWYQLEETTGTNISDSGYLGHQAVLSGASSPESVVGIDGNAIRFDGVDDKFKSSMFDEEIQDYFTLQFYFKTESNHEIDTESTNGFGGTSGQRYALFPDHGGDNNAGVGLSIGMNGVSVYEHGSDYNPALLVYESSLGTNWHFLTLVYSNNQPDLYIDGTHVRTGLTSPRQIQFPGNQFGGWGTNSFKGVLDDISIYNIAASADQIEEFYLADTDLDNDGLTDLEEYQYSADPTTSDTDSDGLSDSNEVFVTFTDPALYDTDNDGLVDGEDGHISTTDYPAGYDVDSDTYVDGEADVAINTDPLNPDTDNDGLSDGLEWGDTGTDPNDYDTDNDGLVDGYDGNISVSTYTNGTDADLDGYVDGELDWGTDPNFYDTDADGYSDGWEVLYGMSPTLGTTNNLCLWFKLDETNGTTIADSSSSQLDGTLTGATAAEAWNWGQINKAQTFDGSNDTITVTDDNALDLTSALTLSAWVHPACPSKLGGAERSRVLIQKPNAFALTLSNNYPVLTLTQSSTEQNFTATERVPSGLWSHLTAVADTNGIAIYLNGETIFQTNTTVTCDTTATDLTIAASSTDTNANFTGLLDDLRIYDRGLTSGDVNGVYESGLDFDNDGASNDQEYEDQTDPTDADDNNVLAGDLNGDGVLNSADVALLTSFVNEWRENVTQYQYDANGNLTNTINALGHTTSAVYNENNQVVSATDANTNSVSTTYDALGRTTASWDALSNQTTYVYNHFDNVISVTDAMTNTTYTYYNAVGQVTNTVDARGIQTMTYYDDLKRVRQVIAAYGTEDETTVTTDYDLNDNLIRNTNQKGISTEYAYDSLGRKTQEVHAVGTTEETSATYEYDVRGQLIATTDGRGNTQTNAYDALGQQIAVTDREGNTTTMQYDNLGNVTVTVQPDGHTVSYQYDKYSRRTAVIDGGQTARVEYDVLGRKTAEINFKGVRAETDYDAVGNVIETRAAANYVGKVVTTSYTYDNAYRVRIIQNAKTNTVQFKYDALGRKTQVTDELNEKTYFYYDDGVNLTRTVKADGMVISNAYDNLNRVTAVYANDILQQTFTYDDLGRMTSASDYNQMGSTNSVTLDFAYDNLNRATNTISTILGGSQSSVTALYDPNGNKTQITTTNGYSVTRTYNKNDQFTSVARAATTFASYTYDHNKLSQITYGSGITETYSYDANRGWLNGITQSGGDVANTYNLTRDVNGNITDETLNTTNTHYVYDCHDRVIKQETGIGGPLREAWEYDLLGNWMAYTNTELNILEQRTVNAANEYTGINVTNLLKYSKTGSLTNYEGKVYTYDWLERLVKVEKNDEPVAVYTYDALNRRVQKEVNTTNGLLVTTRVYDGDHIIEETVGDIAHEFIYSQGIDIPIAMLHDSAWHYYLRDWKANITTMTDSSGNVEELYTYSTFGITEIKDANGDRFTHSPTWSPFGFTGRIYDPETGFYQYRNRAYAPHLGRFIQRDPAGYVDGLNLYAYAGNNPLAFRDPFGLSRFPNGAQVSAYHRERINAKRHSRERYARDYFYYQDNRDVIDGMVSDYDYLDLTWREGVNLYRDVFKEEHSEIPLLAYESYIYKVTGKGESIYTDSTRVLKGFTGNRDYAVEEINENHQRQRWFVDYMLYHKISPEFSDELARYGYEDNPVDWFGMKNEKALRKQAREENNWGLSDWITAGYAGKEFVDDPEVETFLNTVKPNPDVVTGKEAYETWFEKRVEHILGEGAERLAPYVRHDPIVNALMGINEIRPHIGTIMSIPCYFIPGGFGRIVAPIVAEGVQSAVDDRPFDYERAKIGVILNCLGGSDGTWYDGMKYGALKGAGSSAYYSYKNGDSNWTIFHNALKGGAAGAVGGAVGGYMNNSSISWMNNAYVSSITASAASSFTSGMLNGQRGTDLFVGMGVSVGQSALNTYVNEFKKHNANRQHPSDPHIDKLSALISRNEKVLSALSKIDQAMAIYEYALEVLAQNTTSQGGTAPSDSASSLSTIEQPDNVTGGSLITAPEGASGGWGPSWMDDAGSKEPTVQWDASQYPWIQETNFDQNANISGVNDNFVSHTWRVDEQMTPEHLLTQLGSYGDPNADSYFNRGSGSPYTAKQYVDNSYSQMFGFDMATEDYGIYHSALTGSGFQGSVRLTTWRFRGSPDITSHQVEIFTSTGEYTPDGLELYGFRSVPQELGDSILLSKPELIHKGIEISQPSKYDLFEERMVNFFSN